MRIDVHAHFYPPSFTALVNEHLGVPIRPQHAESLDERLPLLADAGIDLQIISAGAFMPYLEDRAAAASLAVRMNDLYAAAIRPHAGRFEMFGVLPLPHLEASIAEIDRCLDELGAAGIALGSGAAGIAIDDERLSPVWAHLDARAATVYIHPGVNNGSPITGVGPHPLTDPSFGSPSETARCVARLALAAWSQRYPNARLVFANWGGLLPSGWSHFARALQKVGDSAPLDEIRRMWFDTGTLTESALVAIAASYGVDRLVFGTDATYGDPVEEAAFIAGTPLLDENQVEWIFEIAPLLSLGRTRP